MFSSLLFHLNVRSLFYLILTQKSYSHLLLLNYWLVLISRHHGLNIPKQCSPPLQRMMDLHHHNLQLFLG